MRSRFPARALVYLAGAVKQLAGALTRRRPARIGRVLIAHQLLLGDTLMLTPLLAKLRAQYPHAELVMLCPPAYRPLYQGKPYGVELWPYEPRSLRQLLARLFGRGFDLALLPAENRLSWLARALGARWIVAFAGEPGKGKNWPIDEFKPCPAAPTAWGDWVTQLIDGPAPEPYRPGTWPVPPAAPFELPAAPYVLLHLGASTPLKQWEPAKWVALAEWCAAQGFKVVLSCGAGETALADKVDPTGQFARYAGTLSLPQLWQLLAAARLLISLDTGVAHLAHVVGTPSVVLYGPGTPVLFSGGQFWRNHPEEQVFVPDFPCRDENIIFRRYIAWAGHCGRTPRVCPAPRCMHALDVEAVTRAAGAVLERTSNDAIPS